jgi:hypothetical protein
MMMMEVAGANALEVGSLLATPTQLTADKLRITGAGQMFDVFSKPNPCS